MTHGRKTSRTMLLLSVFLLFLLLVALDQMTKWLAQTKLVTTITILPFFHLHLTTNTGAAFGIFPQGHLFFLLLGLCVFVGIVFFIIMKRNILCTHEIVLLGIIEAGILGNLIDRFFRGYVVDFLQIPHWPIFNFADMYISLSIFVFICYEFFSWYIHKKTNKIKNRNKK